MANHSNGLGHPTNGLVRLIPHARLTIATHPPLHGNGHSEDEDFTTLAELDMQDDKAIDQLITNVPILETRARARVLIRGDDTVFLVEGLNSPSPVSARDSEGRNTTSASGRRARRWQKVLALAVNDGRSSLCNLR